MHAAALVVDRLPSLPKMFYDFLKKFLAPFLMLWSGTEEPTAGKCSPVVIVHGLNDNAVKMDDLKQLILKVPSSQKLKYAFFTDLHKKSIRQRVINSFSKDQIRNCLSLIELRIV